MTCPDKRLDEIYQLAIAAHRRGDEDKVKRLIAEGHAIQRTPEYRTKIARMLFSAAWYAGGHRRGRNG